HSHLLELAQLAKDVNAPGNDVFESRNAEKERTLRDEALAKFEAQLVELRQDLVSKPATPEVRSLIASLYEINGAMDKMTSTTDLIFVYFKNGQPEGAARYNAAMDRAFGEVLDEIAKSEAVIRGIQSDNFRAQLGDAGKLGRFEYLIGGVIFVVVTLVMLY